MFEKFGYLAAIIGAIFCLSLIDRRFSLVFARDYKRALKAVIPMYLVFIIWDVLGTRLHIFFLGSSRFMTHWQIIRDFMMEELFFVVLLVYMPLILWEVLKLRERRHV